MVQETNIVLEGKYKGQWVCFNTIEGLVWIGNKFPEKFDNFFYKDTVNSVKKLDEKESDLRDKVHFWLGSVAAAGMSSVQDYIVSVEWKDGTESLIKVRDIAYEGILRNLTKNQPVIDYEPRYSQAILDYESNDYMKVDSAMAVFNSISTYKLSAEYAKKCAEKLKTNDMRLQEQKLMKEGNAKAQKLYDRKIIIFICMTILSGFLIFVSEEIDLELWMPITSFICSLLLTIILAKNR